MSDITHFLDELTHNFSKETLSVLLRKASQGHFTPSNHVERISEENKERFARGEFIGEVTLDGATDSLPVFVYTASNITERTSRTAQLKEGAYILEQKNSDKGLFAFNDPETGCFRFSLFFSLYKGASRKWNHFRRFTFFVDPTDSNKTFKKQCEKADFSRFESLREAFSIQKISDEFYNDFYSRYDKLVGSVHGDLQPQERRDFALLFVIRIIFLGFVQKRGWMGGDFKFLENYLKAYESHDKKKDSFYTHWLKFLFFDCLNSPPGRPIPSHISDTVKEKLQQAPFLNGGLFDPKKHAHLDTKAAYIPDAAIKDFYEFIFSYNFTIEESTAYDEDLGLNPEFLGTIFERLVNKENGAVYTPRTEVDFMCRLALVKWLEKAAPATDLKNLYKLAFKEVSEDQDHGSFVVDEARSVLSLLENVKICDPAVGSGAFPVGMMQVLDDVMLILREKAGIKETHDSAFERKKRIIGQSLYGVEVKEWAVWICQLRLWVSLFIDAPAEYRLSKQALLPSLDFKIRQGDSLVQRIGDVVFPVSADPSIGKAARDLLKKLRALKQDYYLNKGVEIAEIRRHETSVYLTIIKDQIDRLHKEKGGERGTQAKLTFSDTEPEAEQQEIDFSEIDRKIQKLVEMREVVISPNKPLVWNIEFSEIFYDEKKEGFDIVIGNPPYVRQEMIGNPLSKISDDEKHKESKRRENKEYKDSLAEMVRSDFPAHFFEKQKIDAKSDLFTYFYIRGLKLLNQQGVQVFICSNSWLDVGYGAWLQKFLLEWTPIEFIIDNQAKRSFAAADVNTIISCIRAPKLAHIDQDAARLKFVAFKEDFESSIYTENLLRIESANGISTSPALRIYSITHSELYKNGIALYEGESAVLSDGRYVGDKWGGKYLRAPDIFFTLLEKGKDKIVRLSDVAEVRRGITTGANEFFYLTKEETEKWGIESEYLCPVVTTSREIDAYTVNPALSGCFIFCCAKAKGCLIGTNALKYIEHGERTFINSKGKADNFSKRPSCANREQWYSIPIQEYPDFMVLRFRDIRNWNPILKSEILVGDTFFVGNFKQGANKEKYSLVLNSTLLILLAEIFGRSNLGDGLLTTYGPDISKFFLVKDEYLDTSMLDSGAFLSRTVKNIFEETGIPEDNLTSNITPQPLPDRRAVDNVVFDALGLTIEERNEVYRAVYELVKRRINKADSV